MNANKSTFYFMQVFSACALAVVAASSTALAGSYPISLPRMGSVRATDGFWSAREATNRLVTARANIEQCRRSGRIDNFVNAAKALRGEPHDGFKGIFFNDSDVYKAVEGAIYELAMHPDEKLSAEVEELIAVFAAAQEADGYIYTARTLKDGNGRVGGERWHSDDAHELYCMGHLIEAAVAHYETTGRTNFLAVATKAADMMRRTFGRGPGQILFVPGHEEVELALCRLASATGRREYLDTALTLLGMRGMPRGSTVGSSRRAFGDRSYYQDHLSVREQREAVGHSVRAAYLYSAMCDAGVMADDKGLLAAADALWEDIVSTKMHLTGGIGSNGGIEGFGNAYDLPNGSCYLETCAAIANALFNERMFLRTGDAKYLDVVERIAYNGFLSSTSLSGDAFFYPNPLSSRGGYARSHWFGCACCPPNIVRFVPQLINWTYAMDERRNSVCCNFFLSCDADLGRVRIVQRTDYPWKGDVSFAVTPKNDGDRFALKVRIPGWARGVPAPGGLYRQVYPVSLEDIRCELNGRPVKISVGKDGFLTLSRAWRMGDELRLSLPMAVRRIAADERVEADRGRFAVERGPLVYCAEGVDNGHKALNLVLPPGVKFTAGWMAIGDVQMVALKGGGATLVPYFAWANRGTGEMQTWFAKDRLVASGNEAGICVSASHCWHGDTTDALFDGKDPSSSHDESIPRLTFWDHRGTKEWVEIELPSRRTIREVSVYWFDDNSVGKGSCALPAEWAVQSRVFPGMPWKDAEGAEYTTVRDGWSKAVFKTPIDTETIRLRVRCRDKLSAGILSAVVK